MVMSVLPASMVEEQKTLGNGKKVDCLIKLPEPTGSIPVDAKFPLEGFQKLLEAGGVDERKEALRQCSRDIRTHVDDIAEKYLIPGETADIALMFIPSEAVYGDIHAHLEDVVDYAWSRRVFMVSPTTMMAVLASVRAIMRHATSYDQALEVQRLVGLLQKDMERLGTRIEKLDKHFNSVLTDVHEITTSKEKVMRHGDNIKRVELMAVEGAGGSQDGSSQEEGGLLGSSGTTS
jgi:DNA recombination protein RmuC